MCIHHHCTYGEQKTVYSQHQQNLQQCRPTRQYLMYVVKRRRVSWVFSSRDNDPHLIHGERKLPSWFIICVPEFTETIIPGYCIHDRYSRKSSGYFYIWFLCTDFLCSIYIFQQYFTFANFCKVAGVILLDSL